MHHGRRQGQGGVNLGLFQERIRNDAPRFGGCGQFAGGLLVGSILVSVGFCHEGSKDVGGQGVCVRRCTRGEVSRPSTGCGGVSHPHSAILHGADERYQAAHAALESAVQKVFPEAEASIAWDMACWKIPRPVDKVNSEAKGTFDPAVVVVGLADRKAGPTLHIWHPGAYDLLDQNAAWLKEAGFKVMKGCLPWSRKSDYPIEAVQRILQAARDVDQ